MNSAYAAALPSATAAPFGPAPMPPIAWADLVSHRGYLVRFAQRRLRDPLLAEDAVHDVFEAVLSGRAVFAGRAALRSWLTAVLKNKIVDTVRRNTGFESAGARFGDDDHDDDGGTLTLECPQPGPEEIAEQRELLQHTLARIDGLQPSLRDAIRLRVLDEQPTDAVCRTLGISEENLFVRIHRARKQLLS